MPTKYLPLQYEFGKKLYNTKILGNLKAIYKKMTGWRNCQILEVYNIMVRSIPTEYFKTIVIPEIKTYLTE